MLLKRVMGKASFAQMQDETGRIQLFLQADVLGDTYEAFKGWDVGDIVARRRRADAHAHRRAVGQGATALRLLTKSLRPLPDKWHGLADVEQRYRQRYVDLIVIAGLARRLRQALARSSAPSARGSTRAASSKSKRR